MIARVRRARYALATTEPCRRCFVAAGLSCSGRFTLCAALQSSMHVTRKSGCEASRFRAGYSVIAQHHCIPYLETQIPNGGLFVSKAVCPL